MRVLVIVIILALTPTAGFSQAGAPAAPANPPSGGVAPNLDRLQAAASQANLDIAHMRIEKWKTDGDSKRQEQNDADSLQRNLTSALPGLIAGFRAEPQNLNAGFKLYRNLNALYDVLSSFTEAAGAFGPKNEYEALAQQVNIIESVRRDLGDSLEAMTAQTQTELDQLRMQVHALQQAAVPAAPPKTVVVDNAEPPKKSASHKKKKTNSGTSSPSESGGTSSPPTNSPKPQ